MFLVFFFACLQIYVLGSKCNRFTSVHTSAQAKPISSLGRPGSRLHRCSQMAIGISGWDRHGWCSNLTQQNTVFISKVYERGNTQAERDQVYLEILKYTADSGNAWFRGLYDHGIWIPAFAASSLVPLGWGLTEPWFSFGIRSLHVEQCSHLFSHVFAVQSKWLFCEEGYACLARIAKDRGLKLYRIKPKLHMHEHVLCLWCVLEMERWN